MKRFALVVLAFFFVGCSSYDVHLRDEQTIEHLKLLRAVYIEDIAAASSTEDVVVVPGTLNPNTPFAGDLEWETVEAALGNFDAFIDYELSKTDNSDKEKD